MNKTITIKNVDIDLINLQKEQLIEIRNGYQSGNPEFEDLSRVIHLLDAIQNEAEKKKIAVYTEKYT